MKKKTPRKKSTQIHAEIATKNSLKYAGIREMGTQHVDFMYRIQRNEQKREEAEKTTATRT